MHRDFRLLPARRVEAPRAVEDLADAEVVLAVQGAGDSADAPGASADRKAGADDGPDRLRGQPSVTVGGKISRFTVRLPSP